MKTIKWFILILGLVVAAPAYASGDVANENTGADSTNSSSFFVQEISNVKNVNQVNVKNEIEAAVETGGNEAVANTGTTEGEPAKVISEPAGIGGGEIETGSASFDIEIKNVVNTNRTILALHEEDQGNGNEEGGIGGGEEAGIGGGAELISTPTETLPAAGPDPFAQLGTLFLLPLALVTGGRLLKTKVLTRI